MRRAAGVWILVLFTGGIFGLFLALSGNHSLSVILVLALHLLVVLASNAKMRVLGEPLLFTDLALIGAMFRHPQFYFSVIATWQKVLGIAALVALLASLGWLIEPSLNAALTGAGIYFAAWLLLEGSLRTPAFRRLAARPDVEADVRALGLVPTLMLYWRRWLAARRALTGEAAAPLPAVGAGEEDRIIVVVQCESFADPQALFGPSAEVLPELERARRESVQWGNLLVSGFGAYTMRTEYGVLFGTDEETLGFRRYDPYLTALEDPAPALPRRLGGERWTSLFVHPHDMRFYERNRILPRAGFDRLVGEEEFDTPGPGEGRYVKDARITEKILELAKEAQGSALLYAVTIENHGPWADDGSAGAGTLVENYVRLVREGDTMLGALREGLAKLGKPATLVFFGDHRPSIPGSSMPGGERHTPYVILRTDVDSQPDGQVAKRKDLTPAELHRAILQVGTDSATRLSA